MRGDRLRRTRATSLEPDDGVPPRPPVRLHALLATKAPIACVIRRGPSAWCHIARWDLTANTLDHGAWLRATLYPERCGLSPDGSLLAAFILSGKRGSVEWGRYFAVSRVPWLHALAAWATDSTWTTGAHFGDDGSLTLAGALRDATPTHGSYPGRVLLAPVDTHWTRARLQRELHTGWREVPHDAPWLAHVPAPIAATPQAVVVERTSPHDSTSTLVLVSLGEKLREYYLRAEDDTITPLDELAWAEWHPDREANVIAATRTGQLVVLGPDLVAEWSFDMNTATPKPSASPEWAHDY